MLDIAICDVTKTYLTKTYLWCHSSLSGWNPLVMSLQFPDWSPLVRPEQRTWLKSTWDVTAVYLTKTHLWSHSTVPDLNRLVRPQQYTSLKPLVRSEQLRQLKSIFDVTAAKLTETHLWWHSSLTDWNPLKYEARLKNYLALQTIRTHIWTAFAIWKITTLLSYCVSE